MNRKYILAYVGELTSDNMKYYFWVNDLTKTMDLDQATKFTLQEARETLSGISVKDDWEIWSIKYGYILDKHESL